MNNIFQEKRNTFLLLVGLLFVFCFVLYFAFLNPLLIDVKQKKLSIESLRTDVTVLEKKVEQLDGDHEDFKAEQTTLQKKIPTTRKLGEIVLTLQNIERKSSSSIKSIDFQYENSLPTTDISKEQDLDEESGLVTDFNEKPKGLQIITVQMDISSPSYEDFLQFITDIEQEERIMSVSQLHLDKPIETEISSAEESKETLIYNVDLITFYYDN